MSRLSTCVVCGGEKTVWVEKTGIAKECLVCNGAGVSPTGAKKPALCVVEPALFASRSLLRAARLVTGQGGNRICHFTAPSAGEKASFRSERGSTSMRTSSLIRGLAQVDSEGKIALPRNILMATDLKEKDAVELKIIGASKARKIVISKHQNYR